MRRNYRTSGSVSTDEERPEMKEEIVDLSPVQSEESSSRENYSRQTFLNAMHYQWRAQLQERDRVAHWQYAPKVVGDLL